MDSVPVPPQIEDVQLQTVDELPRSLSSLMRELHESAGRAIQSTLREWARAAIGVDIESELQAPYSEYTRTLELPVAIASLESAALGGSFLICMDGGMSSAVTDILLGGPIRESTDRWPTTTDLSIRSHALEQLSSALHDAFRPLLTLDAKITKFEPSPNFIFDVGPDDPIIAYVFAISLGEQPVGKLAVIYPFASLRPLLDQVPVGSGDLEPPPPPSSLHLDSVEVELRATIGPTTVGVGEFLSLEPGDVLVLDQWADQPTLGLVQGMPLLEMTVGASSGHVAAVVERWRE